MGQQPPYHADPLWKRYDPKLNPPAPPIDLKNPGGPITQKVGNFILDAPGDLAEGALNLGNKAVNGLVNGVKSIWNESPESAQSRWDANNASVARAGSVGYGSSGRDINLPKDPPAPYDDTNDRADNIMSDVARNNAANRQYGQPSVPQQSAPTQQPSLQGLTSAFKPPTPAETSAGLEDMRANQGIESSLYPDWYKASKDHESLLEDRVNTLIRQGAQQPKEWSTVGPDALTAAQNELATARHDMVDPENPLVRNRAFQNDTESKQHSAQLAGFLNPQAAAEWQRKAEMDKIHSPADVANITGGYGVQEARIREEGYNNQNMMKILIDQANNQRALEVARTAGNSRVDASVGGRVASEIGRIREAIAANKLDPNDPNVKAQLSALEAQGAPRGVASTPEVDVKDFVNQFRSKHPQARSINDFLNIIKDPNGEYGGFDSPAEEQHLIKTLQSMGIR